MIPRLLTALLTVAIVVGPAIANADYQKWVRIVPEIVKPGWVFRNYLDCDLRPDGP